MPSVKYQYDELMNPVLQALKLLGGSGTNEETDNKVAEIIKMPTEQLEILHNPEKGGMTEIEYRLMWTRTYLKKYSLKENSSRGIWSLTKTGSSIEKVVEKDVVCVVREQMKKEKKEAGESEYEPNKEAKWQEELLDVILKIPPPAFERLIQRLLRESGFIQVQVTGQSGDCGVDRLAGPGLYDSTGDGLRAHPNRRLAARPDSRRRHRRPVEAGAGAGGQSWRSPAARGRRMSHRLQQRPAVCQAFMDQPALSPLALCLRIGSGARAGSGVSAAPGRLASQPAHRPDGDGVFYLGRAGRNPFGLCHLRWLSRFTTSIQFSPKLTLTRMEISLTI